MREQLAGTAQGACSLGASHFLVRVSGTLLLSVAALALCGATVGGLPNGQEEKAQALLDAVRQAQKPTSALEIHWTYEDVRPHGAFLGTGSTPPNAPPLWRHEGTALLDGARSRVEIHRCAYRNARSQEPLKVQEGLYVFDGTAQKSLKTVNTGRTKYSRGSYYLEDKTTQLVNLHVYRCPLPLTNAAAMEKYRFMVEELPAEGRWLLEAVDERGLRTRLTIDGTRGFNVVKAEKLKSTGEKYYEINTRLAQTAEGVWYPAECERVEHTESEPFTMYRVRVEEFEPDAEIPPGAFEVEFPHGMRVYNGVTREWFDVGEDPAQPGALLADSDELLAQISEQAPAATEEEPPSPAAEGPPAGAGSPAATPSPADGGLPGWLWVLLAVAVACLAVGAVWLRRRHRGTGPAG